MHNAASCSTAVLTRSKGWCCKRRGGTPQAGAQSWLHSTRCVVPQGRLLTAGGSWAGLGQEPSPCTAWGRFSAGTLTGTQQLPRTKNIPRTAAPSDFQPQGSRLFPKGSCTHECSSELLSLLFCFHITHYITYLVSSSCYITYLDTKLLHFQS